MMRVIFYHVGKGDLALFLLPNGQSMLIDCYKVVGVADAEITDTDTVLETVERHILEHRVQLSFQKTALAEAVGKEQAKQKKIPIDLLAITHADRDHLIPKAQLLQRFDVGYLIDSGRHYGEPNEPQRDYMAFRKEMNDAGMYRAFTRAEDNIWSESGAVVDVLCPNRDIKPAEGNNAQCLVLRIEFKGISFLMTGDSELDDWINAEYGILALHAPKVKSDILNVSHHGSRTFFTPSGQKADGQDYSKSEFDTTALKAISPTLSFITCSDDVEAEHPHPIALKVYQELTNRFTPGAPASHVILSRNSQHLHQTVDSNGSLYIRTSRSRCNHSGDAADRHPYLQGTVSGGGGYKTREGIWVCSNTNATLNFSVEAKGAWSSVPSFDWWVINNGQGPDALHREFYTMESSDRKRKSSWSRNLVYTGVHIMQCHAFTASFDCWANWAVLICSKTSLPYAERWLQLFPGCIDPSKINRSF